jgi:hypothetical protein
VVVAKVRGTKNCSKVAGVILFCYMLVSEEEKKRRAEANSPLFVVKLKDTELLENTYLRFMIKVKGQPNPTLKL